MFDLSLAHTHRAERERELVADLRARQILKAADAVVASEPTAVRRGASARTATRARALGR
jgi:hypothetical protein